LNLDVAAISGSESIDKNVNKGDNLVPEDSSKINHNEIKDKITQLEEQLRNTSRLLALTTLESQKKDEHIRNTSHLLALSKLENQKKDERINLLLSDTLKFKDDSYDMTSNPIDKFFSTSISPGFKSISSINKLDNTCSLDASKFNQFNDTSQEIEVIEDNIPNKGKEAKIKVCNNEKELKNIEPKYHCINKNKNKTTLLKMKRIRKQTIFKKKINTNMLELDLNSNKLQKNFVKTLPTQYIKASRCYFNFADGKHSYFVKAIEKKEASITQTVLEILIANSLNHINLMKIHAHYENLKYIFLVFIFFGKNLEDHVFENVKTNSSIAVDEIFEQILDGICYLHKNDIIHRDIKPKNILISNNKVKICDFGVSIMTNRDNVGTFGTKYFKAPEFFDREVASKSSDIYALGCTLMFLYKPTYVLSERFLENRLYYLESVSNKTHRNLIELMLEKNPEDRPTCFKIKNCLNDSKLSINAETNLSTKDDLKFSFDEQTCMDKTLIYSKDLVEINHFHTEESLAEKCKNYKEKLASINIKAKDGLIFSGLLGCDQKEKSISSIVIAFEKDVRKFSDDLVLDESINLTDFKLLVKTLKMKEMKPAEKSAYYASKANMIYCNYGPIIITDDKVQGFIVKTIDSR
jgi:serine/threonine protein kinase